MVDGLGSSEWEEWEEQTGLDQFFKKKKNEEEEEEGEAQVGKTGWQCIKLY